jgi:hypothetical protein
VEAMGLEVDHAEQSTRRHYKGEQGKASLLTSRSLQACMPPRPIIARGLATGQTATWYHGGSPVCSRGRWKGESRPAGHSHAGRSQQQATGHSSGG